MDSSERKYRTLDGLRGVASLIIVIRHIPYFMTNQGMMSTHLCVDLFFILSGFVLASAYEEKFRSGMPILRFAIIRVVRLYPLFLFGTILGIPVAVLSLLFGGGGLSVAWTKGLFVESIPYSLLMLPTPPSEKVDLIYPFNPVLWSIFYEVVVNIIYRALWPLLKKDRYVVMLSSFALVFLVWAYVTGNVSKNYMDVGYSWGGMAFGSARVLFSFFLGVLIFRRTIGLRRITTNLSILCVVAVPMIFYFVDTAELELITVVILFPFLVFISSRCDPGEILVPFFNKLGVTSYAVYAIHKPLYQIILGVMIFCDPKLPGRLSPFVGFAYILFLFEICVVVDRYYDLPARRWLARRLRLHVLQPVGVPAEGA